VVTNYVKFVGGKRGKANKKLKPVVIGWVNLQGGQVEIGPNATPAAEIAVKLVNDSLGGIGGHPLVLKECFIRNTEEEGTTCGQRMANDKRVSVVLIGGVVIGNQSFYAALGGKKPIVGSVIILPVDEQQKNGFALFGSATSVLLPDGPFAKNVLHAKTAAVVYPQVPGLQVGAQAIAKSLEAVGIQQKTVAYDPNATDLVGPLTAAGAQTADVIISNVNADGCVNLAKALDQLRSKAAVVSQPLCLDPAVAKGLGGDYPKWIYAIASSLGADLTDKSVPPARAVFKKYGKLPLVNDPWYIAFGQTLTVVKWLNAIGPTKITPAAIVKQARAFRGPVPLGAPAVQCGKDKAAPAVCNDRTQFFQYQGAFKFKRLTGWIRPPA
jgi:branched-chain amino acid transport system substrate-binding protein